MLVYRAISLGRIVNESVNSHYQRIEHMIESSSINSQFLSKHKSFSALRSYCEPIAVNVSSFSNIRTMAGTLLPISNSYYMGKERLVDSAQQTSIPFRALTAVGISGKLLESATGKNHGFAKDRCPGRCL